MKYLFCLIALLLGTTVNAQHFTYNQGAADTKNYYEEIPYTTVNGKIFTTVEINGKPRKFLFDTGAPVQIMPELFNEIKPPVIRRDHLVDANGAADSATVVSVSGIKFNNTVFNKIPALITGPDVYKCWQIEGVIGSNLFYKAVVRIDPDRHLIIITDDAKKLNLNKKLAVTLVTDNVQNYPFAVIWLSGKNTFLAGFDTGDSDFLIMNEIEMKRLSKINAYQTESAGYGSGHRSIFGLQKYDTTYRLKFPALSVAGYTFNNAVTETNKTYMTRIGTKMLDYGMVTIDFIHHLFYFQGKKDTINLDDRKWPLQPIIDSNKLLVGVVWQSLKGQVKPGEQIIAVGDVAYDTADLCTAINSESPLLGNKATTVLTIRDENGNTRKLTINKQ